MYCGTFDCVGVPMLGNVERRTHVRVFMTLNGVLTAGDDQPAGLSHAWDLACLYVFA